MVTPICISNVSFMLPLHKMSSKPESGPPLWYPKSCPQIPRTDVKTLVFFVVVLCISSMIFQGVGLKPTANKSNTFKINEHSKNLLHIIL